MRQKHAPELPCGLAFQAWKRDALGVVSAYGAAAVRRVAALVRASRAEQTESRLASLQRVARAAHASIAERSARVVVDLESAARAYEADGAPPPLLHLARRSTDEKPYNAYLGWIFDPSRGHAAAGAALRAIAEMLSFDALSAELTGSALDVEVRCEESWPDGAGSSKQPDLLVLAPRQKPRAILLVENKVYAGESGEQYAPYRRALETLARHHRLPKENCAAYLLAPDGRETPADWNGTLTHAALAGTLRHLANEPTIPTWDRALCFLVAEAFLHEESAAVKINEVRGMLRRFDRGEVPKLADLRRAAELLPLPEPFHWRLDQ